MKVYFSLIKVWSLDNSRPLCWHKNIWVSRLLPDFLGGVVFIVKFQSRDSSKNHILAPSSSTWELGLSGLHPHRAHPPPTPHLLLKAWSRHVKSHFQLHSVSDNLVMWLHLFARSFFWLAMYLWMTISLWHSWNIFIHIVYMDILFPGMKFTKTVVPKPFFQPNMEPNIWVRASWAVWLKWRAQECHPCLSHAP